MPPGSRWGLVRYWWVAVKLATTTVMTCLVLFLLTPNVRALAAAPAELSTEDPSSLLMGPAVSSALLVLNTLLSVYKPWGRVKTTALTAQPVSGRSAG